MGEVVSLKRSTDDDLQELFLKACPEVPAEVDDKVQLAATRALGGDVVYQPRVKTVFLMIAAACFLGAAIVKGVTTRWSNAVDSAAQYSVQANTLNQEAMLGAALPASAGGEQSFRRSKGAWAEYIARLERDPFYQYVQQEKLRFEAQYPSKNQ